MMSNPKESTQPDHLSYSSSFGIAKKQCQMLKSNFCMVSDSPPIWQLKINSLALKYTDLATGNFKRSKTCEK